MEIKKLIYAIVYRKLSPTHLSPPLGVWGQHSALRGAAEQAAAAGDHAECILVGEHTGQGSRYILAETLANHRRWLEATLNQHLGMCISGHVQRRHHQLGPGQPIVALRNLFRGEERGEQMGLQHPVDYRHTPVDSVAIGRFGLV